MKGKIIAALGLGATVLVASQAAMAGVSVGFNVGIPAPVYVAPAPVYAPPPPPVAYAPAPVVAVPVVAPVVTIGWHSGRYWDGRRWYSQREWGYYHGGYGYRRW